MGINTHKKKKTFLGVQSSKGMARELGISRSGVDHGHARPVSYLFSLLYSNR
jgi:hypothetical protein